MTLLGILTFVKFEEERKLLEHGEKKRWLSERQLQWLEEHPHITYVVSPSFAPVDYISLEGRHEGYVSEIIKEIERLLDIRFTLLPTSDWTESLSAIETKTADFASLASHTPKREEYMTFSKEYITLQSYLFLNKDKYKVTKKLKDLKTATIAIPKNYATEEYLKTNYPALKVAYYSNPAKCIEAVLQGRVDGFIGGCASIAHVMNKEGSPNLLFSGPTGLAVEMGFGIRKDWPILAEILTAALGQIDQEMKFEFSDKWYYQDRDQHFWTQNFTKICSIILIPVAFICSYLFLQNKKQRRQIAEKRSIHEAKSRTFASVSHDIRTPLAVMNGMLDLANKEQDTAKRKDQLSDALSSSTYLLSLINEMLTFAKIDSGQVTLTLRAQPLRPILEATMDLFKNHSKSEVSLVSHIDLSQMVSKKSVIVDELRLQQVVTNLISNALKFTEKGRVTCNVYWIQAPTETAFWNAGELESLVQKDGFLIAEIIDTGIGIDTEQLKTIFVPFEQAHSGIEKDFGGAGLGLSICRDICQLYGGDIKATSTLGEGSVFSFAIPFEIEHSFTPSAQLV